MDGDYKWCYTDGKKKRTMGAFEAGEWRWDVTSSVTAVALRNLVGLETGGVEWSGVEVASLPS